jgi:hypothetical protein
MECLGEFFPRIPKLRNLHTYCFVLLHYLIIPQEIGIKILNKQTLAKAQKTWFKGYGLFLPPIFS